MDSRNTDEGAHKPSEQPLNSSLSLVRRKLVLRDTLTFLTLSLVVVALYAVTSFLFRSFEAHREALAVRWASRGEVLLKNGKPDQAVTALRTSLSFAPDDRPRQMLLAAALAESNHTDEASNYFLNLWESQPGDGFINLQLARLARRKANTSQAVDYYRAAIFGSWPGDAITRRRDARLELSDFLIQAGDLASARAELLVAARNAPETVDMDIGFGDRLLQAHDPSDALFYYQKALARDSRNLSALGKAAQLTYDTGQYALASSLAFRAVRLEPAMPAEESTRAALKTIAANSERLLALSLEKDLSPRRRTEHLLAASRIARNRIESCIAANTGNATAILPALIALKNSWLEPSPKMMRKRLEDDEPRQDRLTQLIDDTEIQTAPICGPPTGDDALLLLLANRRHTAAQ